MKLLPVPADIQTLDSVVLTELAQTFENYQSNVGIFFPSRNVPVKKVEIEKVYGGAGMASIVDPNKPDVLGENRTVEKTAKEPIYGRETFHVATDTLNNLRQPGTLNERYGRQYIADETKRYVARNDLLFDFLRCQMLQGGVNYTDPRTQKTVSVDAGIPASHILTNLPAKQWNDPDAPVVDDIEAMKQVIRDDGKVQPTHIMMTSTMRGYLSKNKQVLARGESARDTGFVVYADGELTKICGLTIVIQDTVYEALTPAVMPTATLTVTQASPAEGNNIELTIGGVKSGTYTAVAGDTAAKVAANLANFINGNPAMPVVATVAAAVITLTPKDHLKNQSIVLTATGNITQTITGSPLNVATGGLVKTVTKLLPDHKVVLACLEFAGEPLGRTDFVIGEHPEGKPGIWSRAVDSVPPNPPGAYVQVGRAGMPYLRHPDWVVVRTVMSA
ncbi:major capsid protein [Desulforamulus ruminis]|uniref:major capsid protein n=1 Tax=Desulforamulus ruminis TaxID=1564 RepID=UPI001EE4BB60|nr:major capsid protein [Desulforamulus ruminis]